MLDKFSKIYESIIKQKPAKTRLIKESEDGHDAGGNYGKEANWDDLQDNWKDEGEIGDAVTKAFVELGIPEGIADTATEIFINDGGGLWYLDGTEDTYEKLFPKIKVWHDEEVKEAEEILDEALEAKGAYIHLLVYDGVLGKITGKSLQ